MSKAAIASTANSSAFRKPVQPAVAAVGLNGWKERFPAIPCLMMMYSGEQRHEAGLDQR